MSIAIRPAKPGEAGLVLAFVKELAAYERLSHEVVATEGMIDAALFGPRPNTFCEVAEWDGEPVGFAAAMGFILRTFMFVPRTEVLALAAPFFGISPRVASPKASRDSSGPSSTGTNPRFGSIGRKALASCANGQSVA